MNKLRYVLIGAVGGIGALVLTGSMTLLNGETINADDRHGINH